MGFETHCHLSPHSHRVNQTCERLLIYGVDESDGGSYTCRVQNDPAMEIEATSGPLVLTYCSEWFIDSAGYILLQCCMVDCMMDYHMCSLSPSCS